LPEFGGPQKRLSIVIDGMVLLPFSLQEGRRRVLRPPLPRDVAQKPNLDRGKEDR